VIALTVDVRTKNLLLRLRNGQNKLAYGLQEAVNGTIKDLQLAEFEHVRSAFIVRDPNFLFGTGARPGGAAGRITEWAKAGEGRLRAELRVERWPGSKGGMSLLPAFESGGSRPATVFGRETSAVPLLGRPARPSIRARTPPAYTFPGMRLTAYVGKKRLRRSKRTRSPERGFASRGGSTVPDFGLQRVQWKGANRTFVLTHSAKEPLGGVFQRIGRGPEGIREIWTFRNLGSLSLDDRLRYHALAQAIAPSIFKRRVGLAFADALSHELGRAA
jgi:hypothetical protein